VDPLPNRVILTIKGIIDETDLSQRNAESHIDARPRNALQQGAVVGLYLIVETVDVLYDEWLYILIKSQCLF